MAANLCEVMILKRSGKRVGLVGGGGSSTFQDTDTRMLISYDLLSFQL